MSDFALLDYIHIAFIIGVIVSILYFRRTFVSLGGSMTIGYLAAMLHSPMAVLFTVLVSLGSWAFIRFIVLRFWLPDPRRIFFLGVGIGMAPGIIWFIATGMVADETTRLLTLVGVVVPGMICHSFVKQGVVKTLFPMLLLTMLVAAAALVITFATSVLFNLNLTENTLIIDGETSGQYFALLVVSVIMAMMLQEGLIRNTKLRTGGYVSVGVVIAAAASFTQIVILLLATTILMAIYIPFSRKVPLFGKDRFMVLITLSFVLVLVLEAVTVAITGQKLPGTANLVFCIVPALIAGDVVQHGARKTASGMAISGVVTGMAVVPMSLLLAS
ncbi:poly-gamma-glutamate biosynthesis protein PgsC/CapC [Corynebacterium sputi]|uniref:poly-gamma-glutamate biosynthesis protein PgsC/CapC n=1 Tax=Corynebacterium sputi TaxID=489915 RepID=UPI00041701D6|nr:poly-gamma-glutamate biosynthesis protein PgsC/CapC [Corynebacterium sputi]